MRTLWLPVLLMLCSTTVARGPKSPRYDLDSLIWTSAEIIEVKILRRNDTPRSPSVRVIRVYSGDRQPGARLVVSGLDRYRKALKDFHLDREFLTEGDRVILFLSPEREGWLAPVSSGVWWLHDGRFHTPRHPGTDAWIFRPSAKRPGAMADELRSVLSNRIDETLALKSRLGREPGDPTWLLSELRERYRPPEGHTGVDLVSEGLCRALAATGDFEALASAISLLSDPRARQLFGSGFCSRAGERFLRLLGAGFQSRQGQSFLLSRVADRELDLVTRLDCVSVLPYADRFCPPEWNRKKRADPEYIARIAELAREVRAEVELCEWICLKLRWMYAPDENLEPAAAILYDLHDRCESEQIRFAVARVLHRMGEKAYKGLDSSAGWVIGIVRPLKKRDESTEGLLRCNFEYRTVKKTDSPLDENTVILEGVSCEAWHEIPVVLSTRGTGGWQLEVPLPNDLKPGNYRVFVRMRFGGVKVSDSYAWITELPQR